MSDRDLRHLFSGKHRHHPDFTIVPQFKDIILHADQGHCLNARRGIEQLTRTAELFLSHLVREVIIHDLALAPVTPSPTPRSPNPTPHRNPREVT